MARERTYTWFIEPKNSRSNEIVGKNIGEEDALQDVVCADEKKHSLWRCPSALVFMLWCSRTDLGIKIKIWCQEGNGKIRDAYGLYRNERGSGVKKKKRGTNNARF